MEMTHEEKLLFDQVTDAGMSLDDFRAYKRDIALGDTIIPAEWMKAKELDEIERDKAKLNRITAAKNKREKQVLDQFLDEKFGPVKKKS